MPHATSFPTAPLDVVLHIGSGKTGTSSIQYFLHRNRERLADFGVLYPKSPGKTRHTRLGLFAQPDHMLADIPSWGRETSMTPREFREAFRRRLSKELSDSGLSRVLFSDEALFGSSEATLRNLGSFVDRLARSVRVVVYLRRQDDHLISRYQQVVKVGETMRLTERMEALDYSKTYDYHARLATWQRLVQPDTLVVRRFERDRMVEGSLLQDFLDAAGIDARVADFEQVERRNESLDAEAVELLRLVNLLRREDPQAALRLPPNHDMVQRLAEVSTGPILTAPAEALDAFMEKWGEPNKLVARGFFPGEGSDLFSVPRKTSHTTTEQYLDPARLDSYLALLEVSEAVHAPLRRLVEREATNRPPDRRQAPVVNDAGSPMAAASGPPRRPARSPLNRPVDLVLHLGMGKSGTSSIQYFLRDNRERLAEAAWLYPQTPGRARHSRLGLFAKSDEELAVSPEWHRQKQTDPVKFRRVFRRQLFAEIERSGLSRALMSDEVLFGASDVALRRLRRLADRLAGSLRVVVYLRRQDDHMVSRYQQGVKVGWVQRLSEFATEDMSGLYDYGARLDRQERLLTPDELVVRRFEPGAWSGGSLQQDFLDAAGIELTATSLSQVPDRNRSLDAESVEFLRLLNLYRVEDEGSTEGLIDNRKLSARLAEVSQGPVLTLPAPLLDDFMSQWEESNQLVARRWVGDPGEQLFRTPRKTRNTTTVQHLDPDRLGYFLELLELPADLHAGLRRVVEREAANG